jgi:hypothetical protein
LERLRADLEFMRTQKETLHAEKLEALEQLEALKAEKDARLAAEGEPLSEVESEARRALPCYSFGVC